MSSVYVMESQRFAIPPAKPIPYSQRLLLPFDFTIWILIFSLLLTGIILILFTKLMKRRWRHFIIGGRLNRTPILNMFNSLLGGSVANRVMASNLTNFGTFARTLLMIWILSTLVLRNAYQGSLFHHLQFPAMKSSFDRVDKIVASGIDMYTRSWDWKLAHESENYHYYKFDNQLMFKKIQTGEVEGVVIAMPAQIDYYNFIRKRDSPLSMTTDSLSIYPVTIVFNNHTIFEGIFNEAIHAIHASGHLEQFSRQYKRKIDRKYKNDNVPTKIGFKTIGNIFIIGIVGLCFCFVVFILELLSKKSKIIKKMLDLLTH